MQWIKASERLPDKDGWYSVKQIYDGIAYPEGRTFSVEHQMFACHDDVIEWLDESPDDKDREIERLKGLIENTFAAGYNYARSPKEYPSWQQFKTDNNL